MLVKVMNNHNDMVLVNTDAIIKVQPYGVPTKGIEICLNNNSSILVEDMCVEEFLVKCHQKDTSKMFEEFMKRFEHFEKIVEGGFSYVGKSI